MTDTDILACTLAGEARGEGRSGMECVAMVVMNRLAKHTWYGHTVSEVCQKPFQFSCWDEHDPNLPIIQALDESKAIYREALEIAEDAVQGQLPDRTHGATHYKVIGTPAYWAEGKTPCYTEGAHEFYNDIT